jgi:hypothetical protein
LTEKQFARTVFSARGSFFRPFSLETEPHRRQKVAKRHKLMTVLQFGPESN